MAEDEWVWMRQAVDLGKLSQVEAGKTIAPKVGVVIVKDGRCVVEGYRGKTGPGRHAEYGALGELPEGFDPSGSTVYTTLEPCSRRNHPKVPCAKHLVDAGVSRVFIGMYDPDPRIHREGWRILRDAGIALGDFPAELRAEVRADNCDFLDKFRLGPGLAGEAIFDPEQEPDFFLGDAGVRIRTRWGGGGAQSVHAYREENGAVAVVRYAQEIDDVDDPGAVVFPSTHVVDAPVGAVVVFRSQTGVYAIVKILHVLSPRRGNDRSEIRFQWELRVPQSMRTTTATAPAL